MGKSRNFEKEYFILKNKFDKFGIKVNQLEEKIDRNKILSDQSYNALEAFMNLLTNFASHDIKNAVHNLDGLATNLQPNLISSDEINSIKLCIDSIRSSLEDFRQLASEKEKSVFKIEELISALESLHRPLLKKHKIEFQAIYIDTARGLEINLSFHTILQILNNLVINAFEFLPEEQSIKKIHIKIQLINNSSIKFFILDTGLGINTENAAKIFEPYFTTKQNGSGVGLAHVKHIAEELKGGIEFLGSDDIYNTIFCLTLPLNKE